MDKKTPNDYPQVKFRTGKDLEAELASRSEEMTDSAYSRVAKRDLERYYAMMARDAPVFSEDEALVLVNALNGAKYQPELVHRLYIDVQEYLEENEEYRLSGNVLTLVLRLKEMKVLECMAVIDAVEKFWSGEYHKTPEETQQALRTVGLIK